MIGNWFEAAERDVDVEHEKHFVMQEQPKLF